MPATSTDIPSIALSCLLPENDSDLDLPPPISLTYLLRYVPAQCYLTGGEWTGMGCDQGERQWFISSTIYSICDVNILFGSTCKSERMKLSLFRVAQGLRVIRLFWTVIRKI